MCNSRNPLHCILPPHILDRMSDSSDPKLRKIATQNTRDAAVLRTMRSLIGPPSAIRMAAFRPAGPPKLVRHVYDMKNQEPDPFRLPGDIARDEGQPASSDPAVNEAYDGSGVVYDFYLKVFSRNSLDDQGMPLISSVHCGENFDNAFWNGQQMAYGDGDNIIFTGFTKAIDVIGHELTHGVVSHESDLVYSGQSGALNEHFADAFGSMIRQYVRGETAETADWLIGKEIMVPANGRRALRDMENPGTAYSNDPALGDDPQPAHMKDLYRGGQDNGGVHINSGIPNRAFCLAAKKVGGNSYGPVGRVWYGAMRALQSTADFADMAKSTRSIAKANQPTEVFQAIDEAWTTVGL